MSFIWFTIPKCSAIISNALDRSPIVVRHMSICTLTNHIRCQTGFLSIGGDVCHYHSLYGRLNPCNQCTCMLCPPAVPPVESCQLQSSHQVSPPRDPAWRVTKTREAILTRIFQPVCNVRHRATGKQRAQGTYSAAVVYSPLTTSTSPPPTRRARYQGFLGSFGPSLW